MGRIQKGHEWGHSVGFYGCVFLYGSIIILGIQGPNNIGIPPPNHDKGQFWIPETIKVMCPNSNFTKGYDTYNVSIIIIIYICSSWFLNHFMFLWYIMINDLVFPWFNLKLEVFTRTCLSGRGLDHLPTAGGWWFFSFSWGETWWNHMEIPEIMWMSLKKTWISTCCLRSFELEDPLTPFFSLNPCIFVNAVKDDTMYKHL